MFEISKVGGWRGKDEKQGKNRTEEKGKRSDLVKGEGKKKEVRNGASVI